MNKSVVIITVGALVGLGACSGNGGGNARDKVVNSLIKSAEDAGMTVDKDCVKTIIAKIPDGDANRLADNLKGLESGDIDVDTLDLSDAYFEAEAELDSCVSD